MTTHTRQTLPRRVHQAQRNAPRGGEDGALRPLALMHPTLALTNWNSHYWEEMDSFQIHSLLKSLAKRRPVFWSEADFQHELAGEISRSLPLHRVRLEWPLPGEGIRALDLLVTGPEIPTAIELKYMTKKIECEVDGETFSLRNQGAQDVRRYDVLKDVARMEDFCRRRSNVRGYVVAITNDSLYWTGPSENTNCSAFSLRNERMMTGRLDWLQKTGPGTMKNREKPIELMGDYKIFWHDYSDVGVNYGQFKYTVFEVGLGAPEV
ncbi:MAG: hypothetical protein ACK4P2_05600 [Hyphomonas sp.]